MTVTDTTGLGLQALEQRVAEDLPKIAYPSGRWVTPHHTSDGTRILDVLIVGGGQGGTAIAHALTRQRIVNLRIVDQSEPGLEGPWNTYARMATLRSPKAVTGPDLDIPSLTFQAWFEAQHGTAAWEELNKIAKGDWLMLCYPSGNRDETKFDQPFEFDIERTPNKHVAFGYGAHVCLGQHLARLEMRVLWEELAKRVESFELNGTPTRMAANFVCGPKSVPIRFKAA